MADLLDKWDVFHSGFRLFRESCVFHKGNYVKDLSKLGRDLPQVIIVDNSPASYIFHPENAVRHTPSYEISGEVFYVLDRFETLGRSLFKRDFPLFELRVWFIWNPWMIVYIFLFTKNDKLMSSSQKIHPMSSFCKGGSKEIIITIATWWNLLMVESGLPADKNGTKTNKIKCSIFETCLCNNLCMFVDDTAKIVPPILGSTVLHLTQA